MKIMLDVQNPEISINNMSVNMSDYFKGTVSGSGTEPLDYGSGTGPLDTDSRGPVPDTEPRL